MHWIMHHRTYTCIYSIRWTFQFSSSNGQKIVLLSREEKYMYISLQYSMDNIIISQEHFKISSNNQDTRDIKAMQKTGPASPINHSWQQAGLWQCDGWQQWNETERNAPYVQLVTLNLYCHTSVPPPLHDQRSNSNSVANAWRWCRSNVRREINYGCPFLTSYALHHSMISHITCLDWIKKIKQSKHKTQQPLKQQIPLLFNQYFNIIIPQHILNRQICTPML